MKSYILDQIEASYNKTTWFVPLKPAIEGLTAEQAAWTDTEETNSIHDIIRHLLFYKADYLKQFKEGKERTKVTEIQQTFEGEESWEKTVQQFFVIMDSWLQAVEEADEEKLQTWSKEIAHICQHITYHTGQIVHIRKVQGSWRKEQGIS
ncbi:Uncharacterized damage-inducible protein DinB (forms a four-helix bundle) [Terribacillus aidingensis]|uniref:Uncharacterized damage-inducible protein DinB (Forms a four-helix bundle) n=1 Tax=Terribacillus aidingensis TaxID=586416 RepID=A0A285P391_9BACI|nr:DinB family protein [Terribacillus aidingensis]SNZ15908.1 Uncharacterized damage-inducible protein DinB (forms a four-helix bundle) [Terribacillus aidingensis]